MIPKPFQRLSVSQCFAGFVWQGRNAAMPISISMARKSSWQTACVQDFFSQYNWSGRPRGQFVTSDRAATRSFSVTLPVQTFFECFVWAGQPQMAPQPMKIAPPAKSDPISTIHSVSGDRDFKLSNFSNLF